MQDKIKAFIETLPKGAKIGLRVKDAFPEAVPDGDDYNERLYRYLHNIADACCKTCGKPTPFNSLKLGYRDFCSVSCQANNPLTKDRRRSTMVSRHGKPHFSQTGEYSVKYQNTMQLRYGVDNAGQMSDKRHRAKELSFLKEALSRTDCTPLFQESEYHGIRDDLRTNWYPFVCPVGHRFEDRLYGKIVTCPVCNPSFGGPSSGENDLAAYVGSLGFRVERNTRKIISPKELDIFVPDKNVAIEYCGNYWHSDARNTNKMSHYDKMVVCREKGIRLITVFEDEWVNKPDIVKSRIAHIMGKTGGGIFARKCGVRQLSVSEAKSFCEKHHIQGYAACQHRLGLIYGGDIVGVMTFSKHRFGKISKWEMVRFVSVGVVGGGGKLLEAFAREHRGDICLSYADQRYSDGNIYEKLGFSLMHETKPNYWYVNPKNTLDRKHRLSYTKKSLVDGGSDSSLTEEKIMSERGFHRLWDCGSRVYEKVL